MLLAVGKSLERDQSSLDGYVSVNASSHACGSVLRVHWDVDCGCRVYSGGQLRAS